eukprot:8289322-Pyramimonas_sp.AAC.1
MGWGIDCAGMLLSSSYALRRSRASPKPACARKPPAPFWTGEDAVRAGCAVSDRCPLCEGALGTSLRRLDARPAVPKGRREVLPDWLVSAARDVDDPARDRVIFRHGAFRHPGDTAPPPLSVG